MSKMPKIESNQVAALQKRVKLLCADRGMKIGAVGQLIGKTPLFFNNVFKGKQNIYMSDIELLSSVLCTTPGFLLGDTDDPLPHSEVQSIPDNAEAESAELLISIRRLSQDKRDIIKKLIEQMSEKE